MSSTLHLTFVFKGTFDEGLYSLCPYATPSLHDKVVAAAVKNFAFLEKFKGVHLLSTQLTDGGRSFRVMCERTNFHLENPGIAELYTPGYYP